MEVGVPATIKAHSFSTTAAAAHGIDWSAIDRKARRHYGQANPRPARIEPFVPEQDAVISFGNSVGRTISLLDVDNAEKKRHEIRDYFHAVYDKTEELFSLVTDEDAFYIKHEPLRHPPIFYYGHTACFYINKLILANALDERINPKIEHMCAVGVDEMSWDDLNDAHYDWPKLSEVQNYRDQVRHTVDDLIMSLPLDAAINWESPWWPILMGIEHENIHTETSSAILRQCPTSMLESNHPQWAICDVDTTPPKNELVPVAARTVVYDKNTETGRVYGWDNEYGQKVAEVPAFKASRYLCSNMEFLEFVQAGGYENRQWWDDEGWTWVQYTKAQHPKYWIPPKSGANSITSDGKPPAGWRQRQLTLETELKWSWPVITNQLEAKAFCNWKAAETGAPIRLPSEDEWRSLRSLGEHAESDLIDFDPTVPVPGNLNLERFASECPVDMFEWGCTGFYDVIGNVWQWTEQPIDGFKGFKVHPLYDDFSTPTFDGKHTLFKGGSWISLGANGATLDARYSFRRHFFQHAGFRYVESDSVVDQFVNMRETDPAVLREIDAQYSTPPSVVGQTTAAEQYAAVVSDVVQKHGIATQRVLDLNCGTGRRTFELAKTFAECVGMDTTARHIQVASRVQDGEIIRYTVPAEGTINTFKEASAESIGIEPASMARCLFVQQPDLANIDQGAKYGVFDVVVAANVIERLSVPRTFLGAIHNFVAPGGLLVLGSTYNWNDEITPVDQWVGGYKDSGSGENLPTVDTIAEELRPRFRRLDCSFEISDVRRQTLRSMTVDVSEVTVWERIL